jgi:hypothetical protein
VGVSAPWSREWLAKLLDDTEWAWAESTAPQAELYRVQADAILAALPEHPVIQAAEAYRAALDVLLGVDLSRVDRDWDGWKSVDALVDAVDAMRAGRA